MGKDFHSWHDKKTEIDDSEGGVYFDEREIWYCSIGLNVGCEQDGQNDDFERPVLVFRKFSRQAFCAIPLSTSLKKGKYYFPLVHKGRQSVLVLSQMRLLDSKRLQRKVRTLSMRDFYAVKLQIIQLALYKNDPPPSKEKGGLGGRSPL